MANVSRVVGTVDMVSRYPVKSMAGEALRSAELRMSGLRGDREYAFAFADRLRRFPWLSARDLPDLVRYRGLCRGAYAASGLPVEVLTPDGRVLAVDSPDLEHELARAAEADVRAIQISRGAYDSLPLSVISTRTLEAVGSAYGKNVPPERFRPNLVIDSEERDLDWRGGQLEIGEEGPIIAVVTPIKRCVIPTINPASGARDPALLRVLARRFGNEIGEYAVVIREGAINVGAKVRFHVFTQS